MRQTFCWDQIFQSELSRSFALFAFWVNIRDFPIKSLRCSNFCKRTRLFHPVEAPEFFIENHEIAQFEASIALFESDNLFLSGKCGIKPGTQRVPGVP